jgi:hypothetical protein
MAGARYSASGNNTLTGSPGDTCLSLVGITATLRRSWTYEIIFGNEGTPADNVLNWKVGRVTAEGTATPVVPTRLDLADAESDMNVGENHSGEPTYTATEELLEYPLNTRGTFRWVSTPGSEIITPATNEAGYGIVAIHTSGTDYRATALWVE